MIWTHHRLTFRLLSPLHVGHRKVGNLMETRRYVPGRVLWAALTARLTRDDHDGNRGDEYQRIGGLVRKHFRFGYLWPSLDGQTPYFPWKHPDFDYLFLGSYASTALDYRRSAALAGQLHETEFIAPRTRTDGPVFLLGNLWVKDSLPGDLARWQVALERVQLGGERGYGWGRVRLAIEQDATQRTACGFDWQEKEQEIVLTIPSGNHLTAHAMAAGVGAVTEATGPIEPLVGWERQESGRYGLSKDVCIAYTPWAVVKDTVTVRIGRYGIWEAAQ